MKKWIIYGVLLCSIIFNVIFITRACQFKKRFPPIRHHNMKPHQKESLRIFFKSKRKPLRKEMRKADICKDKLMCRLLKDDLDIEELELLRDSLINVTVKRENKFIDYLIEYKNEEKERSKK